MGGSLFEGSYYLGYYIRVPDSRKLPNRFGGCLGFQGFLLEASGSGDLCRVSELRVSELPIGPIVVPFRGSSLEFYKAIPKRNYYGPMGKRFWVQGLLL